MQPCYCAVGKVILVYFTCGLMFPSRISDSLTQHRCVGFILYPLVTDKMSVEISYFPRKLTFEMDKMLLQYRIGKSVSSVLNIEFRIW